MADGVFDKRHVRRSRRPGRRPPSSTWKVSPNFEIDPEVAYAEREYDSTAAAGASRRRRTAWWVGAVFDWSPVKNLDFALDAVYESSHQTTPRAGPSRRPPFQNNADGFNGRLHVVRSF